MAREGGRLALVDRSELNYEVRDEIAAAGGQAIAVTADLEKYADCSAAMAKAHEAFGRIDILINNVGGTISAKPYAHYEEHEIEAEFAARCSPRSGAAERCCPTCWRSSAG